MNERRTVTIERHFAASPAEVWELWTTPDGIEAWWGPDGFRVEVHALDLHPGGTMTYSMIAVADEMRAFMEAEGMPVATTHDLVFVEVVPCRRLAFTSAIDFVPGVEAYDAATRAEFAPDAGGTRLVLTLDAMHTDEMTERATTGWSQQLDKFTRVLGGTTE